MLQELAADAAASQEDDRNALHGSLDRLILILSTEKREEEKEASLVLIKGTMRERSGRVMMMMMIDDDDVTKLGKSQERKPRRRTLETRIVWVLCDDPFASNCVVFARSIAKAQPKGNTGSPTPIGSSL